MGGSSNLSRGAALFTCCRGRSKRRGVLAERLSLEVCPGVCAMFHLSAWDSFLLAYVVSVGAWLIARDVRARRAEKKANLEGQVIVLQKQVATLSGQLERLSSAPPPPPLSSPVLVVPRSGSFLVAPSLPRLDDGWGDEPTSPKLVIPVEIVDDAGELEVPSTLRSGYPSAAE